MRAPLERGTRSSSRGDRATPRRAGRCLDTNVLIAALIACGVCADLLEHCVREHTVFTSQPLLDELREVLTRKFRQRESDVRNGLSFVPRESHCL
jgi:predicted nucleic acid-binding protein